MVDCTPGPFEGVGQVATWSWSWILSTFTLAWFLYTFTLAWFLYTFTWSWFWSRSCSWFLYSFTLAWFLYTFTRSWFLSTFTWSWFLYPFTWSCSCLHLHLAPLPVGCPQHLVRFNLDPRLPIRAVMPPLGSPVGPAPGTVFPGTPDRVFA